MPSRHLALAGKPIITRVITNSMFTTTHGFNSSCFTSCSYISQGAITQSKYWVVAVTFGQILEGAITESIKPISDLCDCAL